MMKLSVLVLAGATAGRTVMPHRPGTNDVRRLGPGVYFLGTGGGKVVVVP